VGATTVSTLQLYLLRPYLLWPYLLWLSLLWQVMGRHAALWLLPIDGAGPTVDAARWEASWEASWEISQAPLSSGAPQLAPRPPCLLGLARLALGDVFGLRAFKKKSD
jgi:hypothetical protein